MSSTKKATQSIEVKLTVDELKDFGKHIITNNRYLQKSGKTPVSIEVEGESGIGKTSAVLQLAKEMSLNFVKLNLAQIEELGDLVGFPIRQFEMKRDEAMIWVDEHNVDDYKKMGYIATRANRMGYCPPEWIANKQNGGILLLDDWNRADVRFIQAVMELIDRQQYVSWKLPHDWHIILTSNPATGDYNVNEIDVAQRTRFINTKLKFDVKCWAKWAEEEKIDTRCINFLLMHPELVTNKVNARAIVMFFNSISSIPRFENQLPLIQMIGEGSVGPEFSTMFTTFINNNLDRLLSPEEIMLNENEKYILDELKRTIGDTDGKSYRADIASTIATRVINYSVMYSKEHKITDNFIKRISKLITEKIFANDLRYHTVKQIYIGNTKEFAKMTADPKLTKFALS